MSKNPEFSWNDDKLVDDVDYEKTEAEQFKSLLNQGTIGPKQMPTEPTPGAILKGRIVEFTKDHVVVDVGLKSEGLVPIHEFSDPSQLILDGEVEVLSGPSRR